jgi:putative lipase involved disintegration of autophagic bodies
MLICSWNSVASSVISVVRAQLADYPDYSIVTSGHSLGGIFVFVYLDYGVDLSLRVTGEPCGDLLERKLP